MKNRNVIFYLVRQYYGFFLTLPLQLVIMLLDLASFHIWSNERRYGIRIIDSYSKTFPGFVEGINDALQLIAKADQRRIRRIRSEINNILNAPVLHGGDYSRFLKTCTIDLRCFHIDEDRETWIFFLACTLVHEATHGYLFRRRILHCGRNFRRIEACCIKEEVRFAN